VTAAASWTPGPSLPGLCPSFKLSPGYRGLAGACTPAGLALSGCL